MVESATTWRMIRERMARLFGFSHGGNRDLWASFGYPPDGSMTVDLLMSAYIRNGIASRVVRAFPQATWREPPLVRDTKGNSSAKVDENGKKNPNYSPFVAAWEGLCARLNLLAEFERFDRLSSIGQYGVLLMGFRDGNKLDTPLGGGKAPLIYVTPYAENHAQVTDWEKDPQSPRYGRPTYYNLTTGGVKSGRASTMPTVRVHYSRVLHVAEHLDEDAVYGTPRLMPVYNHLLDLEKVVGSGAETFWRNASGAMALTADKDAKLSPEGIADLKEQAEEFEHQLRRILAMQGVTAQMLSTPVADPQFHISGLLDLIAGGTGIPKRILIGSERGELASSQDETSWLSRIDERQNNFVTPFILNPFVQRMIDTQNLPAPQGAQGEEAAWWVEWPESSTLTPQQEAEINARRATALKEYALAPGAEAVVPASEFRSAFLGLPPTAEIDDIEEPLDETDPEVQAAFGVAEVPADTALNGAQITALKDIVAAVGAGELPPESAVQLILVGFPAITEEDARKIIEPMIEFAEESEAEAVEAAGTTAPEALPQLPPPPPRVVEEVVVNAVQLIDRRLRTNLAPRSLYIRRDVLNAEAIREHFKRQGLGDMVPAEEMHVTICYSRRAVDWMKMSTVDWAGTDGKINVPAGGPRLLERFGIDKNVLVQVFNNDVLQWRHDDLVRAGASWDFADFNPHITLTYNYQGTKELIPYEGPIELGPEMWQEISDDWKNSLKENHRA